MATRSMARCQGALQGLRASQQHTCDFWQFIYPRVCKWFYANRPPLNYGSDAHMKEVWDMLPNSKVRFSTGGSFRPSRWLTFERKVVAFAKYLGFVLAGILYVCICKGYETDVARTGFSLHTREDPPPVGAAPVVAAPPVAPAGAHPHASLGLGPAAATSAGRSVKLSNDVLSKLRSDAPSGLCLATRVLMLEENNAVAVGCARICEPVAAEQGKGITMMKTQGGSLQWTLEHCSFRHVGI